MKLVALVSLGCALLTGCGGHGVTGPDRLAGSDVAAMAERELEAENPRMATGVLTCPDLDLEVGASVRCLHTAVLTGGRIVKVRGTVTVRSLDSGGRLHVAMDRQPLEFGLTGDRVGTDVARRFLRRSGVRPRAVHCPYLRGEVGTTITCRVLATRRRHDVDVRVTSVDPDGYGTSYVVTGWPATD
jgi:hypothetical protein